MALFAHPAAVCMTYAEHWRLSMRMAALFATAALKAAVHAFLPFAFASASTDAARRASAELAAAGCRNKES